MFKEGQAVAHWCPKCDTQLICEMGSQDCSNNRNEHYTIDIPLLVCPKCDYTTEFEEGDSDE